MMVGNLAMFARNQRISHRLICKNGKMAVFLWFMACTRAWNTQTIIFLHRNDKCGHSVIYARATFIQECENRGKTKTNIKSAKTKVKQKQTLKVVS